MVVAIEETEQKQILKHLKEAKRYDMNISEVTLDRLNAIDTQPIALELYKEDKKLDVNSDGSHSSSEEMEQYDRWLEDQNAKTVYRK